MLTKTATIAAIAALTFTTSARADEPARLSMGQAHQAVHMTLDPVAAIETSVPGQTAPLHMRCHRKTALKIRCRVVIRGEFETLVQTLVVKVPPSNDVTYAWIAKTEVKPPRSLHAG